MENEENSVSDIALCFQNVSDPVYQVLYLWTFQSPPFSGQEFSLVLTLDYSEAQAKRTMELTNLKQMCELIR